MDRPLQVTWQELAEYYKLPVSMHRNMCHKTMNITSGITFKYFETIATFCQKY